MSWAVLDAKFVIGHDALVGRLQRSGVWSRFRESVRRRRWAWLLGGLMAVAAVLVAATLVFGLNWRTHRGHDLPVLESHMPDVGGTVYLKDPRETIRCGLWPMATDCPKASLFEAFLVDCTAVSDLQADIVEAWTADGFRRMTDPSGDLIWRLATDDVSTGEVWAYLDVTEGRSGIPSAVRNVATEQIDEGCSIVIRLSVE